MKAASASEMREIDRKAQEEYGLSGDLLMERAALAALQAIEAGLGSLLAKKIRVFCGKGNNGGDGLALARLLAERQAEVSVVLAFEPEHYSGLAAQNLLRTQKFGVPVVQWEKGFPAQTEPADLLVDALLGTGSKGVPRGTLVEIIQMVNDCGAPVYALDLPSGIDADTGRVPGIAVRAAKTITFGLPQPGLLVYPGAEYTGELLVAAIGFPQALLQTERLKTNYLTADEVRQWMPQRPPTAHKGSSGHILVAGGSPGMTGAVALTVLGALRAGCGLVTAGLRDLGDWPEKPMEAMAVSWSEAILRLADYRCVVIGPGMTTAGDGEQLLLQLLQDSSRPLVIDADGLNILAQNREWIKQLSPMAVLTPHPGEMARLTGLSTGEVQADRLGVARRYAREWNAIVVLKGARTVIALPDKTCYINLTGNAAMATAGMGDVLAGVIGSLIGQGSAPSDAAVLGVYMHGRAGDLAALAHGPAGVLAGDVVACLPNVWREMKRVES